METKQKLMKHFAGFLRNQANGKTGEFVSAKLVNLLNRKDLIAIIERSEASKKPTPTQLAKLENVELSLFINSEFCVLLYLCEQWCKEEQMKLSQKPQPKTDGASKKK